MSTNAATAEEKEEFCNVLQVHELNMEELHKPSTIERCGCIPNLHKVYKGMMMMMIIKQNNSYPITEKNSYIWFNAYISWKYKL